MDYSNILMACNYTELYQICVRAGVPVTPNLSRNEFIALLLSEEKEPKPILNPMDSWRLGLLGFIKENWKVLQNQVTCPLKAPNGTFNETACFGCIDTRVITCIVNNQNNEQLIRKHKR